MAIKFDELLEALDPSLDEYLDESLNEAYETDIEIKAKPEDPYNANEKVISRPEDPYYTGNDEFLNEDFSKDNIDYIGERLSRYIRRNGWDSFFDYPAVAVRDNSGNNRHFVVKSIKNSIIITDGDYKPIYSHELKNKNDLKIIVNEASKEIIKNVKRFKIVHVNESLNEDDIYESKLNESSQNKKDEFFRYCLSNDMDYELICDILVDNLDDKTLSSIMNNMKEYNDFTIDESLNEAKYWNNKQNTEFYNDIRYKVDEAVYQIMKDIFKDLKIDKLAAQVHNLVPEYDPSWATHRRDDDNNLRLHKVRTGLSASLLDELSDKMNPGSLDRTVNNLRKYR